MADWLRNILKVVRVNVLKSYGSSLEPKEGETRLGTCKAYNCIIIIIVVVVIIIMNLIYMYMYCRVIDFIMDTLLKETVMASFQED